jgi:hypothetical protein
MKWRGSALLAATLVLFWGTAAGGSPSELEAKRAAEAAFLDHTHHTVTKYTITHGPDSSSQWIFVIAGEGEFDWPGHAWVVRVDKKTGRVTVPDPD